jgi:excisionase family DNA binding protein
MTQVLIDCIDIEGLRALIKECVRAEINPLLRKGQESVQEDLISIIEVAAIFKVSKVTIHKWKREGRIPFHKVKRKLYFKRSEVLKNIEQDTKNRYRL